MEGKGKGLVILLSGKPGCGKTLTAEAVAEVTRKPLYMVSAGELGTTPETVDKVWIKLPRSCQHLLTEKLQLVIDSGS